MSQNALSRKVNGNGKVILDTHPESDQHQNWTCSTGSPPGPTHQIWWWSMNPFLRYLADKHSAHRQTHRHTDRHTPMTTRPCGLWRAGNQAHQPRCWQSSVNDRWLAFSWRRSSMLVLSNLATLNTISSLPSSSTSIRRTQDSVPEQINYFHTVQNSISSKMWFTACSGNH